ncbi:hypothetical protein [Ensifer adhaerens]|uniref:hypothetical protein n=1 Tax=Ensifer adhaerens TaxID=106592 RepID=UPI001F38DFE4|nr:hypothetical protein [Ensifer adhaerens]
MSDERDPVAEATFDDGSNLLGGSRLDNSACTQVFRRNSVVDRGNGLSVLEISFTDNFTEFGLEFGVQAMHSLLPVGGYRER